MYSKKTVGLILSVLLLQGCSKDGDFLEKRILAFNESQCQLKEKCLVDLNKLIDFEWDAIYFINGGRVDISKLIGIPYNENEEMVDLILILNKEKIVYRQRFPPRFKSTTNPNIGVIFEYNKSPLTYYKLTKDDAIVVAEKVIYGGADNFQQTYIYPSNENQIK